MIAGMGTDVVDVERVRQAWLRRGDQWLRRVLSPGERRMCAAYPADRMGEFLAGRFAAKEAMAKAAGCGLGRLCMNKVELTVSGQGLQVRFLYDDADWTRDIWHVSISHTPSVAFAVAVRERGRAGDCTIHRTGGIY